MFGKVLGKIRIPIICAVLSDLSHNEHNILCLLREGGVNVSSGCGQFTGGRAGPHGDVPCGMSSPNFPERA